MLSSSASSSGEDKYMIEDAWGESDDELEGGVKSLCTCSSSVEAISLNPESCGESFGSAHLAILGTELFDCLGVRGVDKVAFFCEGDRMLDGVAEAFVTERFGLAFNSFCRFHANFSSPSTLDIIEGSCTSAESRDEEIEITDDGR